MTRAKGLASHRHGSMSSDTLSWEKRRKSAATERWRFIRFAAADVAELVPAGVASQWMTTFLFRMHSDDSAVIRVF